MSKSNVSDTNTIATTASACSSRSTLSSKSGSDGGDFGTHYLIEGVEELDMYQPGGYHPVLLGQTFSDERYEIVHKLGHGGNSTIWLARDKTLKKYVAIKILIADADEDGEQKIADHLASRLGSDSAAKGLLSVLLDTFSVVGPNGTHKCLVMEPGRMSLSEAKDHTPVDYQHAFRFETHRAVMGQIIQAVAKLHENGVVHGDLHSGNILFHLPHSINNLSVEELYEKFGEPVTEPVKRCDKGELSNSVPKEVVHAVWFGVGPHDLPVEEAGIFISDFGESYLPAETERHYSNTPKLYRPPEARFSDDSLSFPSDVWTLGCLLFKIISIGPLFRTFFERDDVITSQHVEACGKLPEEWWAKWEARSEYCHEDGTFLAGKMERSLEDRFQTSCQDARTRMKTEEPIGEEEKRDFLDALRKIMVLDPRQRPPVQELMQTEWYLKWILPAVRKVEFSGVVSSTSSDSVGRSVSQDSELYSDAVPALMADILAGRPWWQRSWQALMETSALLAEKCCGLIKPD